MIRTVCVTGACGFIGRAVTEKLLGRGDYVYAVDALTYAADPSLPPKWGEAGKQFKFVCRDINDLGALPDVDAVINLAAETHVDNSVIDSRRFLRSNILGVEHLLQRVTAMRHYTMPRFIQISTDEVYGEMLRETVCETAPLAPSSPYAASKAAADLLIQAWGRTYGVPFNLVRPSNCYGVGQYPEKLIPKTIRYLAMGKPIPLHGDAERSWLWVEDCADAILTVLDRGAPDTVYNISGDMSVSVEGVIRAIGNAMGRVPELEKRIRLGLDKRYHVNDDRLRRLGWEHKGNFLRDLPAIVALERETQRW